MKRTLISAAALSLLVLVAACDGDTVDQATAMVTCNMACDEAETSCANEDCNARCRALAGYDEVLAGCAGCLTAAGDDCEWVQRCMTTACDPNVLDEPECATFCGTLVSECPTATDCVSICSAMTEQERNVCTSCVLSSGSDCDAWDQCDSCHGGGTTEPTGDGGGDDGTDDGSGAADEK